VVISLLENDLGASLLFVFMFLSGVFALPLLLAWLERPHQTVRHEVHESPVSTTHGSADL
jgi:hypothetical protein